LDNMEGIVFNIQRYSIDDGPGVRTTVFLKGCPLKCLWCSNPESQSPQPELSYRYTACKRCGTCVRVCPNHAISLDESGVRIDRSLCRVCGTCVKECAAQALKISGQKMTVDEVMKVVKKDMDYYEASGGGITCSGGEILCQPDFVAELFRRCRELNIHTNADTSGFGPAEAMEKILSFSDLVFYDLKHMDPAAHKKLTGVSNEIILGNLAMAVEKGVPVVIRVPLIPEYNNSDENLRALAETVSRIAPNAPVEFLPYHRYGANKYPMVGMRYQLEDLRTLTEEETNRAKEIVESYGLKCEVAK